MDITMQDVSGLVGITTPSSVKEDRPLLCKLAACPYRRVRENYPHNHPEYESACKHTGNDCGMWVDVKTCPMFERVPMKCVECGADDNWFHMEEHFTFCRNCGYEDDLEAT